MNFKSIAALLAPFLGLSACISSSAKSPPPFGCTIFNELGAGGDFHSKRNIADPAPKPPVYRITEYTYFVANSSRDSYLGKLKADPLPPGTTSLNVNFNGHRSPEAISHDGGMIELLFSLDDMWELTRKIPCPEHPLFLLWDTEKMKAGLGISETEFITLPITSIGKSRPATHKAGHH
jgi:hypothetical protein